MDVAVIGAGAAGLSASLALVRAGAQVTLYERGARPGGRMRTETLDGARVDVGVQLVSSSQRGVFDLSRDAGVSNLLHRSPGRDALWRGGRANPITYGSVASMAASGALPAMLKLRLAGRYLPFLTSQARTLDANDPVGTGGVAHDRESIAAWGVRELGADFVELLVYPLVAAYYGSTPEQMSAGMYHALARMGMDVSVTAAAGGFGALADGWLAAIEIAGGRYVAATDVVAIDATDDAVTIHTPSGATAHEAAIIAVPAPRAAQLLAGTATAAWLARVNVEPTLTFAYRMDREFPGDYFGLSFPRRESPGDTVVALCVQGRKLAGLVPPGGDALVALPAPSATRALLDMEDYRAARVMLDALETAVSGITKHVVSTHVTRFDDGYTSFPAGYLAHVAAFDEAALPRRVQLAGEYRVAPSVEGAVRSGNRAAQSLVQRVMSGT